MTDLLQIKEEKEVYKVIDKKLYAVTESTKEKRFIGNYGCDVLHQKLEENEILKRKVQDMERAILETKGQIASNYMLIGDLYKCGYCDLSKEVVEKDPLTGRIINTYGTHLRNCVNGKDVK